MKVLVIGHPEAVLGFALVGVHGIAASSAEQANQALDEALSTSDIGIVLITDDVAGQIKARVDSLKLRGGLPLVVEIPGPQAAHPEQATLGQAIQQAIGVKV